MYRIEYLIQTQIDYFLGLGPGPDPKPKLNSHFFLDLICLRTLLNYDFSLSNLIFLIVQKTRGEVDPRPSLSTSTTATLRASTAPASQSSGR